MQVTSKQWEKARKLVLLAASRKKSQLYLNSCPIRLILNLRPPEL